MRKYVSLVGLIAVCTLGLSWSLTQAEEPKVTDKPADAQSAAKLDQAALEKEFEKTMSGCALVGKFTVVGSKDANPREERYIISKVKKQDDGEWIFVYKYGDGGDVIPVKLKVEWAGDTPVITLTDFTIPGVGTFTSRVLIYRGWYAGTWQHGDHGGHLYGTIEKLPESEKGSKKKAEKEESKPEESKKE